MTRTLIRWPVPALLLAAACGPRGDVPASTTHAPPSPAAVPEVTINDNRRSAGRLADGVLTVRLEARNGTWYPDGRDGLGLPVAAFAEEGKPLQNPGPLIRVPAGTAVHATVRNSLAKPLTVYGLGDQRGIAADSVRLAPGELREMRFTATAPGTYYYAGTTTPAPVLGRGTEDSQLNGAIVVEPSGLTGPADRVFLISWWFTIDSTSPSGLGRATLAINGRSWPHTERLDASQGDSLHWRLVNLTGLDHPMHLHGFYFSVDGTGDGARYATYAAAERRRAVTEVLPPGGTMALAWSPDRPGNWIFHCHAVGHISHLVSIGTERGVPALPAGTAHRGLHTVAAHQMAGLVLGIRVAPRGVMAAPAADPRRIRLLVRSKPNVYGTHPGYAYVLGGTPEASDSAPLPRKSPTLVLAKDQPVAITVVNRSKEPAAVHWHGIELESFPDGVPGWSGNDRAVLPAIAPGDSLTVRFTPPRAGTFMYHSHFDEFDQIATGLYGPIVVTEPGQRFDAETDRVLLFSDAGPTTNVVRGPFPPALLNGSTRPAPLDLRAGITYRFRLINIRTDYTVTLALLDHGKPARWRLVAKDGADLPATQATVRRAQLTFAPGEIYDVEYTPHAAGRLTLRFGPGPSRFPGPPPTSVAVRVR
jgi:FtsP/CotA-like multicopper oxidase with cupredoxin domain